jgi:YVTN family beta-propeller protein
MRLSPRLSLFLTLAWTLVLFGGWALLSEMTSEAAPPAYDPNLEFEDPVHIPVGNDPRGIAVVGDYVYVANHDDDTISIIDADTLTVTQVISANLQPCAIAYNPNNGYLYVTNRVDPDGTVTILDTDIPTYTEVTVLGVGVKPTGIAFNPNDDYMYVALNYAPGSVKVISDTSVIDTVTDTLSSFNWPAHIAVKEASNLLYVTNHGNGTVSVINGHTRAVTKEINLNLPNPWGIAVNQNTGWVYAAATTGGKLGRIQPNDIVTDAIEPVPSAALSMVAIDSGNNLVFVTEDEPDASPTSALEHVLVFDAEAGDWVDELEITVQQDPQRGIAFDPVRHRLYVSNRISDTVTVIQTMRKLYFPIILKSFS